MKITSTFAILDVKQGRRTLAKHLQEVGGVTGIPVTITGHVSGVWGRDDGISREFTVDVINVVLGPSAPKGAPPDPRDPRPDSEMVGKHPMFRDHNCARCHSGERACVEGNPGRCSWPHARND